MSDLQKITKVSLPFDRRDPDPKHDYGIHGLDIYFILKGPKGVVQFAVTFPTYLPHVELEKESWKWKPQIMGTDVGYHSPKPMYEGQQSMDNCDLMEKCYYDGSSLRADEWAKEIFAIRGAHPEDEIWRRLENEYKARFKTDRERR